MPLLIPHVDPAGVTTLAGASSPSTAVWAAVHNAHAIDLDLAAMRWPAPRVAMWTGSLADDRWSRDVRTWGPGPLKALESWCDAAAAALAPAGRSVLLRPHARHVLSDVQRTFTFISKRAGSPIGLLLEPTAFLEPDMLAKAEDHLRRAMGVLGPLATAVWLTNVAAPAHAGADGLDVDESPPPLERVALGSGLLDPSRLIALVREHVPPSTPIIAAAADAPALEGLLAR